MKEIVLRIPVDQLDDQDDVSIKYILDDLELLCRFLSHSSPNNGTIGDILLKQVHDMQDIYATETSNIALKFGGDGTFIIGGYTFWCTITSDEPESKTLIWVATNKETVKDKSPQEIVVWFAGVVPIDPGYTVPKWIVDCCIKWLKNKQEEEDE